MEIGNPKASLLAAIEDIKRAIKAVENGEHELARSRCDDAQMRICDADDMVEQDSWRQLD